MATPSFEQVRQLLEAAQLIASHQAQVARLTGANFNVFRLLRMEEDEVRLHSRFIAGLLDPRGSHGQGSAFLEMFLRQVECSLRADCRIDAKEAWVFPEYYIGSVDRSDTDSTGGRIDIFITDGSRHISVENKIGHDEGDDQVTRYCNHEPESNFVLFLTLDGRCAKTDKCNHAPVSYGQHIIPWLERCHQHCADLPLLREAIKQYLVVVRKLTGRDPMQGINEDYRKLLRRNMEAARLIYLHYKPTVYEAVGKLASEIRETMRETMKGRLDSGDWEIKITIEDDPNGQGLVVRSTSWPGIGTVKWQYSDGNFLYGFLDPDGQHRDKIRSRLGERVGELNFRPGDKWWAFCKHMSTRNVEEDLASLLDEQERTTLASQVACELIDFIYACDCEFKKSAVD